VSHVLWSAIATPCGDVDRVVVDVAHGDVRDNDVLHTSLVHLLEGKTAAVEAGAVGNGDIAIATIALCAEFDASTHPVHFLGHVSAIDDGADFIARDDAVGDENVLAELGALEGIAALKDDGIVVRRVDLRVGNGGESAAVDVDAVAVRVNQYVVDGGEVATRDDDGEVTATVDGDVADENVSAELEGNRLVARSDASALHLSSRLRVLASETSTVNASPACDAHILEVLAPDEGVVEIGVSAVLVFRKVEFFRRVVCPLVGRGNDGSSSIDVEIDIALHVDGTAEVVARRQEDGSTTCLMGFLDGGIDGRRVELLAVALGTEVANIVRLSQAGNEE